MVTEYLLKYQTVTIKKWVRDRSKYGNLHVYRRCSELRTEVGRTLYSVLGEGMATRRGNEGEGAERGRIGGGGGCRGGVGGGGCRGDVTGRVVYSRQLMTWPQRSGHVIRAGRQVLQEEVRRRRDARRSPNPPTSPPTPPPPLPPPHTLPVAANCCQPAGTRR